MVPDIFLNGGWGTIQPALFQHQHIKNVQPAGPQRSELLDKFDRNLPHFRPDKLGKVREQSSLIAVLARSSNRSCELTDAPR